MTETTIYINDDFLEQEREKNEKEFEKDEKMTPEERAQYMEVIKREMEEAERQYKEKFGEDDWNELQDILRQVDAEEEDE